MGTILTQSGAQLQEAITWAVAAAATTPKLHTPTVTLSNSNLVITPAAEDGTLASNYIIFSNGNPIATTTSAALTINLSEIFTATGTYNVTVAACAVGFVNSDVSSAVAYHVYGITTTTTHGTHTGATVIKDGTTATVTITPDTGYKLPQSITVSGATYEYSSSTGVITLTNPIANVIISVSCPMITYTVSYNVTNATHTNVTTIGYFNTATITLTPRTSCILPDSVTVTGDCSYTYNAASGVISIDTVRSNLTVTAAARHYNSISMSVSHGTYTGDTRIFDDGTASVTITANPLYGLPDTISVTNASYTYNNTTGVISLSNPNTATNTVYVTAVCPELPQLATPTVTIDGTTATITDNDGNAESFDLYVDDNFMANVPINS